MISNFRLKSGSVPGIAAEEVITTPITQEKAKFFLKLSIIAAMVSKTLLSY